MSKTFSMNSVTRATGPPRSGAGYGTTQTGYGTTESGCRGGSRYFEGVCGSFEIPRIQKIDRLKTPRFHVDPTLLGNPKDSKNDRRKIQGSTRVQIYLEILKIQQIDRPKRTISHADPIIWNMFNTFSKTCLIW